MSPPSVHSLSVPFTPPAEPFISHVLAPEPGSLTWHQFLLRLSRSQGAGLGKPANEGSGVGRGVQTVLCQL